MTGKKFLMGLLALLVHPLFADVGKVEDTPDSLVPHRYQELIDQHADQSEDATREKLTVLLNYYSRRARQDQKAKAIFDAVRHGLINDPGYIDYLRGRLKELEQRDEAGLLTDFSYLRGRDVLKPLELLQTEDAAMMMIDMLDDESRARPQQTVPPFLPERSSNAEAAADAIHRSVENCPSVSTDFGDAVADLATMRDWGGKVKSGAIKLRFRGDGRARRGDGAARPDPPLPISEGRHANAGRRSEMEPQHNNQGHGGMKGRWLLVFLVFGFFLAGCVIALMRVRH